MTLTEFLLARIAEDEAVAKGVRGYEVECSAGALGRDVDDPHPLRMVQEGDENDGGMTYAAATSARVLAECEAKRRIVERYRASVRVVGEGLSRSAEATVRDLASVYADHPDYDEAWRA